MAENGPLERLTTASMRPNAGQVAAAVMVSRDDLAWLLRIHQEIKRQRDLLKRQAESMAYPRKGVNDHATAMDDESATLQ